MKLIIKNLKETGHTDVMKEFWCNDCNVGELQDECCASIGCSECGKEIENYSYVKGERFIDKTSEKAIWVFIEREL